MAKARPTPEQLVEAARAYYPHLTGHKLTGPEIVARNAKRQTVVIHTDILIAKVESGEKPPLPPAEEPAEDDDEAQAQA